MAGIFGPAQKDTLLVESFARGARYYMTAYPFEGAGASTLGTLLTRRMAHGRGQWALSPMIGLAVWGLRDIGLMVEQEKLTLEALFAQDMLGDDFGLAR